MKTATSILLAFSMSCVVTSTMLANDLVKPSHHESSHTHPHHVLRRNKIGHTEMEIITSKFGESVVKRILLTQINTQALIDIVDDPNNEKIRFYFIEVRNVPFEKSLFDILDEFFTPRFWFVLRKFIFSLDVAVETLQYIVIERLPELVEKQLRILAEKNFPTEIGCKSRPLALSNINGDAWGNRAVNLLTHLGLFNKYVHVFASTKRGTKDDETAFNPPGHCMERLNKFECLFLPSTNCSYPPTAFEDLAHSNVGAALYDSATPEGKQIKWEKIWEYDKENLATHRKYEITGAHMNILRDFYLFNGSYDYYHTGKAIEIIDDGIHLRHEKNLGGYSESVELFGMVHRPRADFKWRMQQMIDTFRSTSNPPFHSNMSCVMVHMRKDDRAIKNTDMVEWCRNHTYYDPVMKHYRATVGGVHDFGCHLILPYGAASIEHFLNASLIIAPNIKNIFIATDDPTWLHQALAEYKKLPSNQITKHRLKLFPFHPPQGHKRDSSEDSNAEFFATIEIGQQCSGFVGYSGSSAAARLFHYALCYLSHNYMDYMHCPNEADFGDTCFTIQG